MSNPRTLPIGAIITVLMFAGTAAASDVEIVKNNARQFVHAFENSDLKAIQSLSLQADKETWETIQVILDEAREQTRLAREVFKRFPKETKARWPEDSPEEIEKQWGKLIDDAAVDVNGDLATLKIEHFLFVFHKERDAWKLEVSTFLAEEQRHPRPDSIETSRSSTRAIAAIADRLEHGELRSMDDVMRAMSDAGLRATSTTQPAK